MTIEVGLVGLPNAGKSTLFNALTRAGAAAAPYPFTTVDPNIGVVPVPEPRLERLGELVGQERRVPATLEVVDIAGLVEGAHRGEGLGNRFLARIREVDVVVQVVRCFADPDVAHPSGSVDPVADLETVDSELRAKDRETVASRLDKERPVAKAGDADARERLAELERLAAALEAGRAARTVPAGKDPQLRAGLFLLTDKPTIVVANVSESALPDGGDEAVRLREAAQRADDPRPVVVVAAGIEAELAELEPDEAALFRRELGLEGGALERLVRGAFDALDLVVFFTCDGPEVRAWTIRRGTPVGDAVAQIHTDFRDRFVRAEVLSFDELERHGSMAAARRQGRVRTVGRDHGVEDGEIIHVMI